MRPVRIHPLEPVLHADGRLEVAARVEWPRPLVTRRRQRVWFRGASAEIVAEAGDATSPLLGVLFRCMALARPVRVHGRVAPGLLENLERYQANWATWYPDTYRRVDITADGTLDPRTDGEGAILTYSGGLDSTYAVKRELEARDAGAADPLRGAVMAHGFDIPLDQAEGFRAAAERSRRVLASRGLPLFAVATNVRSVRQDWEESSRAAIGAVLHLFRGRFARGLVANAYEESFARRFFPQEVLDMPLLGSDDLPIAFSAMDQERLERFEAILDWPEALADLRVCWIHPTGARNCGRCGKCITILLAARILGIERPACFDRDVEDHEIVRMLEDKHAVIPLRAAQLLEMAERRGLEEPWMDMAREVRGDDPLRRVHETAARVAPDAETR